MDIVDQLIAGALDAEASGSGTYFNYGRYRVFVDEIIGKKGQKGPMYIPVFYIESSTDLNEVDDSGTVQRANPAGTSASVPCNMSKPESKSNAREFLLALLRLPETGKGDPVLGAAVDKLMRQSLQAGNPFRGMALEIWTTKYTNQGKNNPANRGKTMPRLHYKLIPGQTKETIAANRAKLDGIAAGKSTQQAQAVAAQPLPAANTGIVAQGGQPAYGSVVGVPGGQPAYGSVVGVPGAPPAPAPAATDPFAGIL